MTTTKGETGRTGQSGGEERQERQHRSTREGREHARGGAPGSGSVGFYLRGARWGAAESSRDEDMQGVHRAATRRKLIPPIVYHWSIDPCGDLAVLWRVQDTKHLGDHRVMREGRWREGGGVGGGRRFHASLKLSNHATVVWFQFARYFLK